MMSNKEELLDNVMKLDKVLHPNFGASLKTRIINRLNSRIITGVMIITTLVFLGGKTSVNAQTMLNDKNVAGTVIDDVNKRIHELIVAAKTYIDHGEYERAQDVLFTLRQTAIDIKDDKLLEAVNILIKNVEANKKPKYTLTAGTAQLLNINNKSYYVVKVNSNDKITAEIEARRIISEALEKIGRKNPEIKIDFSEKNGEFECQAMGEL